EILLVENGLARLIVLLDDALTVFDLELHGVGSQNHVHQPGESGLHSAFPAWQLEKVDTAPHQPGQQPAELHAQDFRDRRVMAERSHLAQSPEGELSRLPGTANGPHDIVRSHGRFAHRILRRWRTETVPARIGDEGAIAERPDMIAAFDLHFQIDFDAATLL